MLRTGAKLIALVLATALFHVARADSGTIFFSNRTGDPYRITFTSANGCVIDPDKSSFTVEQHTTYVYNINIDTGSSCSNAQIQWNFFQNISRIHSALSGVVIYRKFKGNNGKWLATVNIDPGHTMTRPVRLIFKATCGSTYTPCQKIAIPSSSTHAVITVFPSDAVQIVNDVMTF